MQRSDEDRRQARKAAGHDIGEELIADHGGLSWLEIHLLHGRPTPTWQRLQGLGHIGKTEPLGEAADPFASAVRDETNSDVGAAKPLEPGRHLRCDLFGMVPLQRAVNVDQQRLDGELMKLLEREFLDPFDANVRCDGTEHGVRLPPFLDHGTATLR